MTNLGRYVPSLAGLCASFRFRSREFLRENTLHGFPYFVDSRRPRWERAAWFACTLGSFCAVVGIIVTIMGTFLRDPALVGLDTESGDTLVMHSPSVTLCQPQPDFHFGPYQADSDYYNWLYNWSWEANKTEPRLHLRDEKYSEIFNRSAPDCRELYEDCKGKAISCGEMFEKRVTSRGVCCRIPATEMRREARPWGVRFFAKTAYPISIDLSGYNSPPPLHGSPYWYRLSKGATLRISLQVTYATEAMESLALYRRRCFLPAESLSYNGCLHRCHRESILEACGCVPWFLLSSEGKAPHRECTAEGYRCLLDRARTSASHRCQCYLPCNNTAYVFQEVEDRNDSLVEIHTLDWPTVIYRRDVRFGLLDLLVSFGGIAGLFLGYSLLTSVELGYYLLLRSYCGAVLNAPARIIETTTPATTTTTPTVRAIERKNLHCPDYLD